MDLFGSFLTLIGAAGHNRNIPGGCTFFLQTARTRGAAEWEKTMTPSDNKETFINVIKSFDVAMLATRGSSLHARPMAVAEVTNDGIVVFVTSLESTKIAEIENDPRAFVTYQGTSRFVSAIGGIRIDRNRAEIKRLWSEGWRVWFPQGMDDPAICLLRFEIYQGEYWDTAGSKGVKYLFEAAKAYFSGKTPVTDTAQHAWVEL
jgi:general stress protein 26